MRQTIRQRRCPDRLISILVSGSLLVLGGCQPDTSSADRREADAAAALASKYWDGPAQSCPRGALDASQAQQMWNCIGKLGFVKQQDRKHWLTDAQMLTRCSNVNLPDTRCKIHTWAVAEPLDMLADVVDDDFRIGAVVVAEVRAGRNYPQGSNDGIRGGQGWRNFVLLENVSGWKAFVLQVRNGEPTLKSAVASNPDTGTMPEAGAARWLPSEMYEFVMTAADTAATAMFAVNDDLWTRCGTGCCTVGFR